ncbi:MAG: cystathionine gamma-synthase [Lentisphaerae bacterium GWF2_45_14]|nr:MAG: cystathionine gamma-synthase [Lentisphaerae bacterium GWF2_45_14]
MKSKPGKRFNYDTRILHEAGAKDPSTGALSVPIFNASTYAQDDVDKRQPFDYSRSGNPTRKALEDTLAALENGTNGYAFASGMAAISSALMAVLKQGDHLVIAQDIYGGTYRLVTKFLVKYGIKHTFVDTTNLQNIEKAILPETKVLFLETPSNPLLKITDVEGAVKIARSHKLISIIDNTFMSPYLFRPLDLGVDIVVHSATKFLGGHSDLIAGAVITATEELGHEVYTVQNTCGAVLGPNDSWLLMRGIKTLGARIKAQQESASQLAFRLREQKWVSKVYYPGLPNHPGHNIMADQADGFGAVLSIETDSLERASRIMKNVKIWSVAVSLGGVESILSYPAKMSHAAMPAEERLKAGITDNLIRLSPGLEDVTDLLDDLCGSAKG